MTPEQLSHDLRTGDGRFLRHRRGQIACTFVAAGCMQMVALYQMGLIEHLPEPPLPGLNADKVDASAEAYAKLSMPDAFLGLASYAVTAALAATGGPMRARDRPWIPLLNSVKALADAAQAAKLTRDQLVKHRAVCSWCVLAAGATFATAALTLPEASEAARNLIATHDEETH